MRKVSVFSPYRVSFSGGGTDVSPFPDIYGGCVINTTIDRGVNLIYKDDGEPLEISSRDLFRSWNFSNQPHDNFLEGITLLFRERGIDKGRLTISGDVPPGTGVGSSSALVLGLLNIINILNDKKVTKDAIAEETYNVERNFFGVTLGRQDPYAISIGGPKYMEFSKGGFRVEKFGPEDPFIQLLEKSTLMLYTGSSHNSSDALQEQVSKLKHGSDKFVERLKEIKNVTQEVRKAIKTGDFDKFVELLNYEWNLKKGLGRSITNDKIDKLIKTSLDSGAKAARLMGGGAEGFILLIAESGNVWKLQKTMMEHSDFVTRLSFDYDGVKGSPIS